MSGVGDATATAATTSSPKAAEGRGTSSFFSLQIEEIGGSGGGPGVHILSVRWFTSIKDVKDLLRCVLHVPPRAMELFYGTLKLSNSQTLHDLGIEDSGRTLRLAMMTVGSQRGGLLGSQGAHGYLLSPPDSTVSRECAALLDEVAKGFKRGNKPISTDPLDCTGGVYFLTDGENRKAAVFKPFDEEQGMANNHKGYEGDGKIGLRPNFKPGQGCMREVAAYVLDHGHFAGVPETVLVDCCDKSFSYPSVGGRQTPPVPKLGSLQRFVYFQHTFDDIGTSCFSDFEVQKIALLDLRLLNCDRNASNILVLDRDAVFARENQQQASRYDAGRSSSICSFDGSGGSDYLEFSEGESFPGRGSSDDADGSSPPRPRRTRTKPKKDQYILVPIDHGYTLPVSLQIMEYDWVWFNMPQVRRPVHPDIKAYILGLDFDSLVAQLPASRVAVPEEALFLLKLAHTLLVGGIRAGLTLHDIAKLIARVEEDTPSPLERTIAVAEENAHRAIEMRSGRLDSRSVPVPFPASPGSRADTRSTPQSLSKSRTGSYAALASAEPDRLPAPKLTLPPRGLAVPATVTSCSASGTSGSSQSLLLAAASGEADVTPRGLVRCSLSSDWLGLEPSVQSDGGTCDGDTSGGDSKDSKSSTSSSGGGAGKERDRTPTRLSSLDDAVDGSDLDFSATSNPNSPTPVSSLQPLGFLTNPLQGRSLQSLKTIDTWSTGAKDWRLQIPLPAGSPRFNRPIKTESEVLPYPSTAPLPIAPGMGFSGGGSFSRAESEREHAHQRAASNPASRSGSARRRSRTRDREQPQHDGPERYDADAEAEAGGLKSSGSGGNLCGGGGGGGGVYAHSPTGDCTDSSEEDDAGEDEGSGKENAHALSARLAKGAKASSPSLGAGPPPPSSGRVPSALAIMRVTSFSSFASEPIYDVRDERQFQKLHREKRRLNLVSPEFHQLREKFAGQRLSVLLSRCPTSPAVPAEN